MVISESTDVGARLDALAAPYRSHGLGRLLALRIADPFARQELAQLLTRDTTLAERIRTGYQEANLERPRAQPMTARDVIDFYGYRMIHCQTIGNALSDVIGGAHFDPRTHDFWEWAFICAALVGVLAEKLARFDDEAFAACLARCAALRVLRDGEPDLAHEGHVRARADGTLLWEGEQAAFGASHLDLARRLAREWDAPASFCAAFDDDRDPDSLPGMILRAIAMASSCGFDDPEGPAFPPCYLPEREPILEAFVRRIGGTEGLRGWVHSMLTTAGVALQTRTAPPRA